MAGVKFTNFASTLIATASVSPVTTAFSVTAATGNLFPTIVPGEWFYVVLTDSLTAPTKREVVKVTTRTGDSMAVVVRAQEGTTAQTWVAGNFCACRATNQGLIDLINSVISIAVGLVTTISSALVSFLQSGTGAVPRDSQSKMREIKTPADYGAVGDGTTDDTTAMNKFFAVVAAGTTGDMSNSNFVYKITAALTPLIGNNIHIKGGGATILYTGASTTPGDLLTIGDGSTLYTGIDIRGFVIGSSTTLTSGKAIRIKKCTGVEFDVVVNGPIGNQGKLWDGVWFDVTSTINMHSSKIYSQNYGVTANQGSELHLNHAWIAGTTASPNQVGRGVYIGGGFGGVYTEHLTQQANLYGFYVDTLISGTGNTQFFISPHSTFDGNKTAAAYIDDSSVNAVSKVIYANGWFSSSSAGNGLRIVNWTGGSVYSSTGTFKANSVDGILCTDNTVRLVLGFAVDLSWNGSFGVDGAVMSIYSDAAIPNNNTNGNYNLANITLYHSRGFVKTMTIANGANAMLPSTGSASVTVTNPTNGDIATYLVGGSGVVMLGTSFATWVAPTTVPGAGKTSVAFDGATGYFIYNNYGSQQGFLVNATVTR